MARIFAGVTAGIVVAYLIGLFVSFDFSWALQDSEQRASFIFVSLPCGFLGAFVASMWGK